ncbi:biofilm regulation protein kinase SiaB [Azonexus sp.]|uniref:biofilm regulation protein kinase SiaB n=1 Tax=Azonexus sp. TaxID=1872668 RepID=UPI0039E4B6AB
MGNIDLFELRQHFNQSRILLCFNGPISRSLIEEIGSALKNYLHAEHAQVSAAMDVFSVYIEMTQNIRHYAQAHGYDELAGSATVVVARDAENRYLVQAGNMVERDDGERLLERVKHLATLTPAELKAAYKTQLRLPRSEDAVTGAGLGLIDIARKSTAPLSASLSPLDPAHVFFSLRATI